MSDTLKKYKEQKGEIIAQKKELKKACETDKRNLTLDERQQWDAWDTELNSLNDCIETMERLNGFDENDKPEQGKVAFSYADKNRQVDNNEVFKTWVCHGINRKEWSNPYAVDEAQRQGIRFDAPISGFKRFSQVRFDQTIGTGNQGGFGVNEAVVVEVLRKLKYFGGMLQVANTFNTQNGAPLKKIMHDSTSIKAVKTDELGDYNQIAETIGKVVFQATKYTSANYYISDEELVDPSYDALAEFTNTTSESFGRAYNEVFTQGDGVGDPEGLEAALSTNSVTATADAITHNNLLSCEELLDPSYLASPKCVWMMNQATWGQLKRTALKDTTGRPMYNTSVNNSVVGPAAGDLDGRPVVLNQDMTNNVIILGDMSRFHVRMIGNLDVKILKELFALKGAIAIAAHQRVDSRVTDTSAFTKLVATGGGSGS